jgi:4-(2-carboxyphenyl)-2-oxobut-3-enoate aldolase
MAKHPTIKAENIKGIIAYLVTPTIDGADRRTAKAIDLDEAARAVDMMIRDGITGFCLNGTFGEGPSTTAAEQLSLTATAVEAARGRVPVFGGATTLNTRESIERVRAARDVGAQGVMLGRPMMAVMNDDNIIRFYRDIAEEVPEMAIVLYDDQEAFKRPITTAVYRELAKIPQIVACKYRTRMMVSGFLDDVFNRDLEAVGNNIKLMPTDFDWAFCHLNFGSDAIWSSGVNGGPAPSVALGAALTAGDRERAKTISKDLSWSYEGLVPPGGLEVWHADKIPFMKTRFAAAGYLKPGPALPPYTYISSARILVAQELGRRAKSLQEKYSVADVGRDVIGKRA